MVGLVPGLVSVSGCPGPLCGHTSRLRLFGECCSNSFLERPSGTPDHHRGLHKHRIRGCGPLLLLLPLISYSKLVT